jgi:hypothetical protein
VAAEGGECQCQACLVGRGVGCVVRGAPRARLRPHSVGQIYFSIFFVKKIPIVPDNIHAGLVGMKKKCFRSLQPNVPVPDCTVSDKSIEFPPKRIKVHN